LVGFPAHCRAILLPIAPTPLIQAVGTHSQPLSNISHSVPTLSNLANGFDLKFFGKSFRLCAHAHDTSRYPHYEANECLGYPGRFSRPRSCPRWPGLFLIRSAAPPLRPALSPFCEAPFPTHGFSCARPPSPICSMVRPVPARTLQKQPSTHRSVPDTAHACGNTPSARPRS